MPILKTDDETVVSFGDGDVIVGTHCNKWGAKVKLQCGVKKFDIGPVSLDEEMTGDIVTLEFSKVESIDVVMSQLAKVRNYLQAHLEFIEANKNGLITAA